MATHSSILALDTTEETEDACTYICTHTHTHICNIKGREVAQSCLNICDTMGCGLPGSSVHGIFQARIPE